MATRDLLFTILAVLVLVPAALIALFPLAATLALGRRRDRHQDGSAGSTISVLLPAHGADEHAAVNLRALIEQVTDPPLEVLVCVEDAGDPLLALVRGAAGSQYGARVRAVIAGPPGEQLGKAHNLLAGLAQARGDWLVLLDSDVTLPHPAYLAEFVQPLADPQVGLVSCYPAYREARNIPAALLASTINHDLLGYFAAEAAVGRLSVANGSCMALRRKTLEAIGGMAPLSQQLLLDARLARLVVEAGLRVRLHPEAAPVVRHLASFREWWNQAQRWQVGMRRGLPTSKFLAFVWMRSWFAVSLIMIAADASSPRSLVVFTAGVTARTASAVMLNHLFLRDPSHARYLWLLPLVELANAAGCVCAWFDDRITWRARRYRVGPGGRVRQIGDTAGGGA